MPSPCWRTHLLIAGRSKPGVAAGATCCEYSQEDDEGGAVGDAALVGHGGAGGGRGRKPRARQSRTSFVMARIGQPRREYPPKLPHVILFGAVPRCLQLPRSPPPVSLRSRPCCQSRRVAARLSRQLCRRTKRRRAASRKSRSVAWLTLPCLPPSPSPRPGCQ